jgi:hypothetical protein
VHPAKLAFVSKVQIVLQIVTLLQGTPVDEFARRNLLAEGNRVIVRCAESTRVDTAEGQACKRSMATALRLFSYRFTTGQLTVLADLYATALEQLEPEAIPRVRERMCDPASDAARRDAAAGAGVCERLSMAH